jgi:lipopolysaccharide/colanic/teichoic acid biosynthesis glycosyltransferase/dTDP-glucose pyrophosphorylase
MQQTESLKILSGVRNSGKIMPVVIAGGMKSRLIHPVTISKAFFPLLNKPAVLHVLEVLSKMGLTDVFVTIEQAEPRQLPASFDGLAVHTVRERRPRGTAGCLKEIEEQLNGHTLVLIAGSLAFFAKEDLEEMIQFHQESGAHLTIGLTEPDARATDSEKVSVDPDGEVRNITLEHHSVADWPSVKTSGLYVMEPDVLAEVRPKGFTDLKEQLVPRIRKSGKQVMGWKHRRLNLEIRNMSDYMRANFQLLRQSDVAAEHLGKYRKISKGVWAGEDVDIHPTAMLVRPLLIGDGTRIEENSTVVGPTVIGKGCVLENESYVRESILWQNSVVPPHFEMERCLLSGRAFDADNHHCREMIVLDGHPSVNGIGSGLPKTIVRGVAEKPRGRGSEFRRTLYPVMKRILDTVSATVLLVMLSPLLGLLALAVWIDSGRPVFFVQPRCGKDGKPFHMIKFRTMVKDAEEIKASLRHLNESDGPMFKIWTDPRQTRMGKFLRNTNLDELPQIVNVLKGDMSLVGPRPLSMDEMEYNPGWRDARLKVKPGITGLWQLYGKKTAYFHDWIRFDLAYVDNCSFWMDLKIIFRTAFDFFRL